jgi:hypothetical protein
MVVRGPLGVREAGPKGPRYYLSVLFSSNEKKHVKCLVDIKSKKRNRLEVEDDTRLKISAIQPDISRLVSSQKIHLFLIKFSSQKM